MKGISSTEAEKAAPQPLPTVLGLPAQGSTARCGISKEGQNEVKVCKGEKSSWGPLGVRAVLQGTMVAEQSRNPSKALGKWVDPPMSHKVSQALLLHPCAAALVWPQR